MRDINKFAARMKWEQTGLMSLNCEWIHVSPIERGGSLALSFQVDVLGMTYLKKESENMASGPHSFVITVTEAYPFCAPVVSFATPHPPAHINFYRNGNVCIRGWNRAEENLSTLAIRIIRCIFLMPETLNFLSVADSDCRTICRHIADGELAKPALPGRIPIPDFGGAL